MAVNFDFNLKSKKNGTVAWEYCGFSKKGDFTNIPDL